MYVLANQVHLYVSSEQCSGEPVVNGVVSILQLFAFPCSH